MKNYDHIIWDWNGTLVDDTILCVEIMDNELKAIGLDGITIDQYRRKFRFPVKEFYEDIGFDFSKSTYEKFAQKFVDKYSEKRFDCSLHYGVEAIIKKCTKYGISHSILSAYSQTYLDEAVSHYKIDSLFENIKGISNNFAGGKVEEGLELLESIDYDKSRVVMIGDTLHDNEVADALGIDSVIVKNGHQSEMVLRKATAPVVASISEALVHII